MADTELIRVAFTLYPRHRDLLHMISAENGNSGDSAALRYILDDYAARRDSRAIYDAHRAGVLTDDEAIERLRALDGDNGNASADA